MFQNSMNNEKINGENNMASHGENKVSPSICEDIEDAKDEKSMTINNVLSQLTTQETPHDV